MATVIVLVMLVVLACNHAIGILIGVLWWDYGQLKLYHQNTLLLTKRYLLMIIDLINDHHSHHLLTATIPTITNYYHHYLYHPLYIIHVPYL